MLWAASIVGVDSMLVPSPVGARVGRSHAESVFSWTGSKDQVAIAQKLPKCGINPAPHIALSAVLESMSAVLQLMLPSSSPRRGAFQVAFTWSSIRAVGLGRRWWKQSKRNSKHWTMLDALDQESSCSLRLSLELRSSRVFSVLRGLRSFLRGAEVCRALCIR